MQGLLGDSWDDPRTMGLLQLAAHLSSAPKPMQGLTQGLMAYQGALAHGKKQKEEDEDRAMRRQMAELQLRQAQQEQARKQAIEAAYRNALRTPQQMAMAANGGPTNAAAQAAPGMAPGIDQNALIRGLMDGGAGQEAYQMLQPKPADLMALNPGQVVYNRSTGKEAFRAPDKPETPDEFTRRMIQAGIDPASPQGQQLARQALTKQTTHAPGANVNVNTGQKGFDNTLKLRGDFRSEPVYKAHQEMQSAYAQIGQALGQASPAGDLAGATKVMKLLDPGSVVRESELGMAMAATGLMDRVQNYASMVMSGTKLTPAQRKDFQTLANSLYAESSRLYNAKRSEYRGIAERNALNVRDVLGDEAESANRNIDALVNKYGGGGN